MMEVLRNMEGQWEASPHPSYCSNSTLIDRESQRNGKWDKKGKYAFKVAPGFEEKNELLASEYQDRWEQCKKGSEIKD